MPNISEEAIAEALAALIESADTVELSVGVVITDLRFMQKPEEMSALLISQNPANLPHGWVLSLAKFANTRESSCLVNIEYGYRIRYEHPFSSDDDGVVSRVNFRRVLFAVNEVLNASIDLGLGGQVAATSGLQSSAEDFGLDEFETPIGGKVHTADFTFSVTVTNSY